MSFGIILPHRWRRQPTTPVGIDWGHPLARSLRHALSGHSDTFDLAGETRIQSGTAGLTKGVTPLGYSLSLNTNTTNVDRAYISNPFRPGATNSPFTALIYLTFLRESSDADTSVVNVLDSNNNGGAEWGIGGNYYSTSTDYIPFCSVRNSSGTWFTSGFSAKREIGVPIQIALVYDGSFVRSFRDGVAQTPTSFTGVLNNTTASLRIGSREIASYNLNANIHLFAMWSRALSQSEIRACVEAPWQFFRPLPRRIYVPSAGTGGGTGTLAVTLDGLTSTASGTLAIKGTSAVTLGALTSAASGKLDIKGTSAVTLGALTSTASGTLMSAGTGTAAITLGALTSSAAGKLDIKGSSAVTLGSVTLGAAGVLAAGPNGNANITLGALTSTAVGKLAISGTSAVTLGSLTSAATGAVAIKGVAGIQLGSLTVAASGLQITSDTRIGSAAITLGDLTAEAMAAPLLARLGNRRLREGALRITKGALPTGRVKRGGLPRIS